MEKEKKQKQEQEKVMENELALNGGEPCLGQGDAGYR